MSVKQRTIVNPVTVRGAGLHTGQIGEMIFKPAPVNHGIKFKRTDLASQPLIEADINHVVDTARGTTIGKNGAKVFTIEHVLAALTGLEIDNVLIELNMEEIPIKDGSSRYFVEALEQAGIKTQAANRDYIEIKEPVVLELPEQKARIVAEPADYYSLTVIIDFETRVLGEQIASLKDIKKFKTEIAKCRTFVFLHELEHLLSHNLIKGGDLSNAIVFVNREVSQKELDRLADLFNKPRVKVKAEGMLNNLELHFDNEPARHKLLDVIGDLALTGKPIKGHITAYRPGHQINTEFASVLKEYHLNHNPMNKKPPFDIYADPVLDINDIKNILPHRSPFLLVDKVLEIDDDHIVALKNVTMDEPFFTGHFPNEPLMPGVLQVEAMAQAGGIFVLQQMEKPELYSTYFLKINDARFRHKVIPGDVIVFVIELDNPIKRGICTMSGKAYVGNRVVMDGKMTAQIVKNKEA